MSRNSIVIRRPSIEFMKWVEYENKDRAWDDWILSSDEGSFYHTTKWMKILERSFDIELKRFELKDGPNTVALFPAVISSKYGFQFMMPLPISDYNNIIIIKEYKYKISEIFKSLKQFSKERRSLMTIIPLLEKSHYSINIDGLHKVEATGTMVLDLEKNPPERIWNEIFNKKRNQRNKINQLEKDGFRMKRIYNKEDLMKFYNYYTINMNFIQATPLEYKHFDLIFKDCDTNEVNAWILADSNIVAGGLISFYYEPLKTLYLKYISLNRELPKSYTPTHSLYWNAINQAYDSGCKTVCFGSTSPDPHMIHYKIKEQMGCEYESKLSYYIPRNFAVWKAYEAFKKVNRLI